MPRCTIRFCQFARSFMDEKELPVRRCSAAQAHLTVGISGERSESAACRVRFAREDGVDEEDDGPG
jgi:hypothetical protein